MIQLTINGQNDIKTPYEQAIDNRIKQVLAAYEKAQVIGGFWKGKEKPVFSIANA